MKMLRLAVLIALGGCAETGDNAASIAPERVSNEIGLFDDETLNRMALDARRQAGLPLTSPLPPASPPRRPSNMGPLIEHLEAEEQRRKVDDIERRVADLEAR